jgi:hypothetical protein
MLRIDGNNLRFLPVTKNLLENALRRCDGIGRAISFA